LKTIKKDARVEEAINNIIENVRFQTVELRKREAELKKSKEFAKSLFTYWPNGASLLSPDGIRIDTNLWAEKIQKRTKEQIINTKAENMYSKEDRDKIRNKIEECKETGFSTCEVTLVQGDGNRVPSILNFTPIKDEKGELLNILFSLTDISKLRKREDELKSAISSFGSVLSKASKGDLTQKVDLSKIGTDYKPVGMDINSMISATHKNIEEIRKREEELKHAVSNFGSVLSTASAGDLTAKVDLSLVSKEYKQIGRDINKMISVTEHNITELRKREEELTSASADVTEIMEAISAGDYQKRVSEDYSLPEVVNLTKTMNVVMGSLKRSDEELKAFIKELATPAIEAVEGVVVMPLVGKLTSDRALDAMEVLLNKLEEVRGKAGIIDITGVSGIDSAVADNLIRTMESIKLFGAEPLLTGVSGKTAQNLARLGIKFDFITKSTLAEGLRYALRLIRQEEKEKGL
jgi:PAS domain S-box-containing protein